MRKLIIASLCVLAGIVALAAYKLWLAAPPDIVVTIAPGPAQPRVSPAEGGIDAAALEAAVDQAGKRRTRALIVARGGHIVFEKYWDGATTDTPLRFDAFSPAIAGVLLGIALNDRAILDVDLPLSRYLAGAEADPRTLRTLLDEGDADTLALVLEQVGGAPYETQVTDKLWKPLGNGDIVFTARADGPRAGRAEASCCIRARIGDWMRLGQLLARDGVFEANQYTPPGYVHAMLRRTRDDDPRGYFTRFDGAFAARDLAWVGGEDAHRLWIVPSLDLVILRVGDGGDPGKDDAGWDESLIPDTIIRGTDGWRPAGAIQGQGTDPKRYAPH